MNTQFISEAKVAAAILAAMEQNGGDFVAAVDKVMGAGTYMKMAREVWAAARAQA